LAGLANEKEGARIEDYYWPKLESLAARLGVPGTSLRILDSGCGNGDAVGALSSHGADAWGHDLSALRKWQWRDNPIRERLVVADGASLPFPADSFDAVIASGVLEHIGVEETGGEEYRVRPLPVRDEVRRRFLAELVRVLAPEGSLFLDFPNGAFPFDFWHGSKPGGARLHSPTEGFLPTVPHIRALCRSVDERLHASALSPKGRLRFRQVSAHWYGRAFRAPMAALQALMSAGPFSFLSASPLNPYLVIEVRRMR
jgi:SAM-dependent methyltransferase